MDGLVIAICVAPEAGAPMQSLKEVWAIAGQGLLGDRYAKGQGSFNKKSGVGNRQVTLMNGLFFRGSGFEDVDSRRNIITTGVELMWLVGREFDIGEARMRGVKYCDPCDRPSKLSGKPNFKETFFDRGGLVAEVIKTGLIDTESRLIPPLKGY